MSLSNRLLAVPLCLALLLASAPAQAPSVCFLTVLKLRDSGYPFQENLVINNSDDWRTIWETIFSKHEPETAGARDRLHPSIVSLCLPGHAAFQWF